MRSLRSDGQPGCATTLAIFATAVMLTSSHSASAQSRAVGADISYWNCGSSSTGISQANWNTAYTDGNIAFVFMRASRGGTTGVDQTAGYPGGGTTQTLSQRYDDPRFIQNLGRATAAGMLVGSYHFARPDVAGNTGTDEADHFISMAGAWMRPGYMMPVYDMEAGSGSDNVAQFAIDFSDRIYSVLQIRPCVYINGNYSSILQSSTLAHRDALAKPRYYMPSAIGPAYPMIWDARYQGSALPVTGNPKDTSSLFYGPWDDYGNTSPWSFWQYSSTNSIPGFNAVDSSCDADVSHGDLEYIRNYLIPAVWWSDSSGDWSTLANWNSGQTPSAPVTPADQPTPYATGGLPAPRLPGAAGTGPTSGQYDTVILERPNAAITVTVSNGTYNIRKLYNRETLNINGGSLTVNYDPTYRPDNSTDVIHGGPISEQLSGPTILSAGSLTVHTTQVDTNAVFTLSGGTLTFNKINLMPHTTVPAKILVNGDVTMTPLNNTNASIAKGTGSGSSGFIDLSGSTRTLIISAATNASYVSIDVPIMNGGLTKVGNGTLRLTAASTYTGGTTVNGGSLIANNMTGSATGSGPVAVWSGVLQGPGTIAGQVTITASGLVFPGLTNDTLTLNAAPILQGISSFRIDRNNGSPLSSKLVVTSGTLNYDGKLVVANLGASLAGGETFTLFSASSYSGQFTSSTLPSLATGLNWYLGDLNVNGSIKVNRKPSITTTLSFTNQAPNVLQIPFSALASTGSDPDNDTLSFASVSATSSAGVTLTTNASSVIYTNNVSDSDQFTYTLSDSHGGTVSGVVNITNIAPPPSARFDSTVSVNNGSVVLTYTADAGATYYIDRSTNLPIWTTIYTNSQPSGGTFQFTDDFHDIDGPAPSSFYRMKWTQ